MTTQFMLRRLMNSKVHFRTSGNFKQTGEVCFLGDGKVGISTPTEVFSYKQVKRVRRLGK